VEQALREVVLRELHAWQPLKEAEPDGVEPVSRHC
jgi:hypothetical protein